MCAVSGRRLACWTVIVLLLMVVDSCCSAVAIMIVNCEAFAHGQAALVVYQKYTGRPPFLRGLSLIDRFCLFAWCVYVYDVQPAGATVS